MQNNSLDSINSALRFLIVEDNPDDAFLLIHHLRTSFPLGSFDVVANKEELSNRLSSPVSFDVVLSDWSLPRLDGLGVLAMVRKAGVDVPFILVSGKIGEEAAIRAIREGVYDYILKDSPQRLPSAIQHALIQYSQEKREKIQNDLITLQVAALQAAPVAIEIIDPQGNIEWINEAYHGLTGRESTEVLGRPASDFEAKNDSGWLELVLKKDIETAGSIVKGTGRKKNNSLYLEERRVCPVRNSKGSIIQFVIIRKDITSEEEEKKELELELFFSETNRETQDLENLCQRYISISQSISLDWALSIQLLTDGERRLERHFGIISNTVSDTPQLSLARREVLLHDEVLARLTLSYPANHVFDQKRLSLILFSHIESAIKELVSQAKIQSQIKKISFLKLISRTISTYMDFETVMRPLLDQIRTVLECDAVALFLVDKEDKTFVCRVKNGYRADFSIGTRVPLHDVIIGAAVEEGKIVSIHDFSAIKPDSKLGELIQREGFRSQHAVPIIVSGQMKGVLEVWFRKDGFIPPPEWLVLYDAIANQTGLALDYNELYDNLQKAYNDLELSYEATIEGWSAAMDLRDQDTEGHSLRVTALAETLGSRLGLPDLEIARIHKGSLLHDIGKIGIPDSILRKPGPLEEDEWTLMREHPKIAMDMLKRIPYLQDSLDIPLYHHERYDGTGYPFGIKGNEIPLHARLFAIVDVYDALICDRPYRKAWPKGKIVDHLKEQKGKHFDPEIVDAFIPMIV